VDALDAAFYKAFEYVEPTNKRWLLGVDISGLDGGVVLPRRGPGTTEQRVGRASCSLGRVSVVSSSGSVLDYIKALVWPVVIAGFLGYLFWRYNEHIGRLIDKVRSVKALGTEWGFAAPGQQTVEGDEAAEEAVVDADIIDVLVSDFEQRLEERHLQAEEERAELLRHIAIKDLQLDFERTYRVIYGSQIAALRALRATGLDGLERASLNALLDQAKATWSVVPWLQGLSLDAWLGFLFFEDLIAYPNGVGRDPVTITPKGGGFLDYIDAGRFPPRIF